MKVEGQRRGCKPHAIPIARRQSLITPSEIRRDLIQKQIQLIRFVLTG
jgi:hypothetical protein